MERVVELSSDEIKMAFVASCIEGAARKMGVSYREAYERMNNVGMIDDYLLGCYDALHTESREYVTEDVIECLLNKEAAR
ncbi:MAG: DUF3791 domain-containing protein [Prevotella sp.]|nr:DUF3791 domain-containing protein [Prevotella sp.]